MRRFLAPLALAVCAALTLTSCETTGDSALAGAATGAAIGAIAGNSGRDVVRGAGIGAGVGYLLGKIVRADRYDDDHYYDREYERDYVVRRYESRRLPEGMMTSRRGFVRSPYRPYNVIDVRGIPRGARVLDPSSDQIFINP